MENIRSFHGRHELNLKRINLLVGENSTGKSTILGVLTALNEQNNIPITIINFNTAPFLFGSFNDFITKRGGRSKKEKFLKLGMGFFYRYRTKQHYNYKKGILKAEYENSEGQPKLHRFQLGLKNFYFDILYEKDIKAIIYRHNKNELIDKYDFDLFFNGVCRELDNSSKVIDLNLDYDDISNKFPPETILKLIVFELFKKSHDLPNQETNYRDFVNELRFIINYSNYNIVNIAPIRSKPLTTYELHGDIYTPEGNHIPFVIEREFRDNLTSGLIKSIEEFGLESGLFSKISIKEFGEPKGSRFALNVKVNGPARNIAYVGYGVSQALPIVTESLLVKSGSMILMQQPEVHLHPRAQAALGTVLVRIAKDQDKRFMIETHSDYIIDRIRQEIAKGTIKSDEVNLIYTEMEDNCTKLYEIKLDENGSLINPPASYRKFFMEEEYNLLTREFNGDSN